jgi:UDP-glucose 4-epimerase
MIAAVNHRVLILGASGFIGSHLTRRLLADGFAVRGFSRKRPSDAVDLGTLNRGALEWRVGDFTSRLDHDALIAGCTTVVHLIAATLPSARTDGIPLDLTSDLLPTVSLLEAARRAGARVIYASSGGTVYGQQTESPIGEGSPTDPICSYGVAKLALEKYLYLFGHLHGLDYVTLRFSNVFGRSAPSARGQGLIEIFTDRILRELPVQVWGDGSTVRDYLHIDDAVDAIMKSISYQGQRSLFNIGSGRGASINDIIALITNASGHRPEVSHTEARGSDVAVNVLDCRRAATELGWQAKRSLEEGIRMVVESQRTRVGKRPHREPA